MKKYNIPYGNTDIFSQLILDYLNQDKKLNNFYNRYPNIDNFKNQIKEKSNHNIDRSLLINVLKEQNKSLKLSKKSTLNIDSLLKNNTYTITTGHQLNIFTGPLFLIYKIISAINLTETLQRHYTNYNFVPIFWMATEDHDFEEINHINIYNNKIKWDTKQDGIVGEFHLQDFKDVIDDLHKITGDSCNSEYILELFKKTYLQHNCLADATRYLINKLFGKYGVVVIDGNHLEFKKQFKEIIKKDLVSSSYYNTIKDCSDNLSKYYKQQAFVRERNFFLIQKGQRKLISKPIKIKDIDLDPSVFSPNVLMRPLFQEFILPNIAYVGGGSEISYWMQLITLFKKEKIPFPILVLRNSVLFTEYKQLNRFLSMGFSIEDIFNKKELLHSKYLNTHHNEEYSLNKQKSKIAKIYSDIYEQNTDHDIQRSILASKKQQLNLIEKLEKKLVRNIKKKNEINIEKINRFKDFSFPNGQLQERHSNFISFYLKYGDNFLEMLKENLHPLSSDFVVLALENDNL
tara:strand:+ start:2348 stop:3895 length:1548 start_codon:yes stop_codon:yes gene_type:complete